MTPTIGSMRTNEALLRPPRDARDLLDRPCPAHGCHLRITFVSEISSDPPHTPSEDRQWDMFGRCDKGHVATWLPDGTVQVKA